MQASEIAPIVVLNSGSSSLKVGVFTAGEDETLLFEAKAESVGRQDGRLTFRSATGVVLLSEDHVMQSQTQALQTLATTLKDYLPDGPIAVGHRVVHGGPTLRRHQRITAQLLEALNEAVHFAPLHIPQALTLIHQAQKLFPACPHFACFDSAFHGTMPPEACRLPLPTRYFTEGVMRYGFHGLSYESIVHSLGESLPPRAVFAHLGSGSSLVAVHEGRSIDTSMGFTPTGGVPMGTRSGDLDPGALLYMMRKDSLDADALESLLNLGSGWAAVADGEADMQILLRRAAHEDEVATRAIEIYTRAVRKHIGAYAALLGGVDLLVFTGGIGQNSRDIRDRICSTLDFLTLGPESDKVLALPTEEERQIARHCRSLMADHRGTP